MTFANDYHRRPRVSIAHKQGQIRDDGRLLTLRPNAALPWSTTPARNWSEYEAPTIKRRANVARMKIDAARLPTLLRRQAS